jgi:serine/threonine protein kinase
MSSYPVKFGKYLLLERVNVGGMAEVFKAKTFGVAGFERILAIKRILPNLVEDDEFIRMFIDEARIAVQLNHTNIVQIYELGKHGDHYYIAMEYVPSRDLRAILDRMRSNGQLMPIPQAAYVTKKVCEGLDYAHKKRDPSGNPMNIIHRDVSPQNILVGFEGEVKVIDFGIAKAANRASKTQAGVLKGKFGYMSPEQVRGLPTDRRSDIFAVGVLLYEMLTGERLFIGESDFSTLERVRNAEVIPPTNFNKKISPALEQIVLKTLAREVDDRFQWASELAEELEPFLVEDKQVFNMKRLAAVLKETYAAEIALERQKMEEFLRVTAEDAKPEKNPQASSLLPLHPHETDPSLPKPPPTAPAAAQQKITAEDEEADGADAGFGEDKTFVIEASAAGVALQNQVTEEPGQKPVGSKPSQSDASRPQPRPPSGAVKTASSSGANAAAMPNPKIGEASSSKTSRRQSSGAPSKPENTNDDFLEQVSLYGDDAGDMDDSRTLVSAPNPLMDNPTGEEDDEIDASEMNDSSPPAPSPVRGAKPPPPVSSTNPRGKTMTAEELSDAPTTAPAANGQRPPPPPARKEASTGRPSAPPPRPQAASKGFDPVAAAMEEEENMAIEALKGTTGGRPDNVDSGPTLAAPSSRANGKAPSPGRGDVAGGPQLPAKAFDATQEAAAFEGSMPPGDDVGMDDGVQGVAPAPVIVQAIPPQMMKLLIVAAGAALLVFLVIVVAIAVKLSSMRSTTQLVLYTAGEVQAPPDLQVSVDDVPLASGLSAPIPLLKGPHRVRIKGSGIVPITRIVRANGGSMRQPVLLVALEPEEHVEKAPEKEKDEGQPPPVVTGGWRLSLAAVADDTGKPVNGADVLINGTHYGRTPLEAEIDPSLDKITVRIKKEGFIAREVPVVRAGRAHVGPATVRLLAGGTASAETPEEKPVKVAEVEKPADKTPPPEKPVVDKAPPPVDKAPPPVEKKPAEKAAASDAKLAAATPAEKPKTPAKGATHLQISASPPAEVVIDGHKLSGLTPFLNERAVPLSTGHHRVELTEKGGGKKVKVDVNIASDDKDNKVIIKLPDSSIMTRGAVTGTVVK